MENRDKSFFIEGTDLTKIDGHTCIPTALHYAKGGLQIGYKAIKSMKDNEIINHNFKVELGEYVAGATKDRIEYFDSADGNPKSAFQLSKDFFDAVLSKVEGQGLIPKHDKKGLKIIVAEPLAFQIEDRGSNWIKNYRDNIRRILVHYDSVEFLPEPFAVYQYYRYGLRIPQLKDNTKNIALIIDFGGGTFDVSVIESTVLGDISLSGKHSKPLAASSEPIGGFFVNEQIAIYLTLRNLDGQAKNMATTFLDTFRKVKKGQTDYLSLSSEKQAFISNLRRLINSVENPKLELCNKIRNWDLTIDCYESVQVSMPKNPFKIDTAWEENSLRGHELRKLFKENIWEQHLKKTIRNAIKRAKEQLKDRGITVTLISGGSSNIRWLDKLLSTDFEADLGHARPIPLSESFQDIVAKGLAIECARRYYNPESEFVSVTYNPVRLFLNPDDKGIEERTYQSVGNKIDMDGTKLGDLIPSAQALSNFINEPLQWKFRLNHPPKHHLKYFFTRPCDTVNRNEGFDTDSLYNVDNTVHSPTNISFDSKLRVELTVKEDGTAIPRFIYKVENIDAGVQGISVDGKPFVLDMTTDGVKSSESVSKYIGFDFGTSNSSICYLSNEQIHALEVRNNDSQWLELKELVSKLPYPISYPLRKYLRFENQDQSIKDARAALEGMLAFAAYTIASELLSKGELGGLFKDFLRSMGPLKDIICKGMRVVKGSSGFAGEYNKISGDYLDALNKAIFDLNQHKHDKLSAEKIDVHETLKAFANICNLAMQGKVFGYLEHIKNIKFSKNKYTGLFRKASDSQPFVESLDYAGEHSFPINEPLLVDIKTGKCISMLPFYFFEECSDRVGSIKCYVFDKYEKGKVSYKAVDDDVSIEVDYEEISSQIEEITNGKSKAMPAYAIDLKFRNDYSVN
ncbi:hypothetical protein [Geobacter sp. AOG1]|uniref:hypothetical protein n=1 Tax=Geobacter sp. AOG1 TaxID=1566346 RepID=UPI001CC4264D|nr:hypothetical protein [Geobacter sp. AOG1]GFE56809.1 hypothetical protein AOG1_06880 [Geobacter sp. AOG1]